MRGALRNLALNLALGATSLLVFALLMEVVLQLAVPIFYRPRFTRVDPVLGWYHQSSVANDEVLEGHEYRLSYNAHGFRSPEHSYEKPDGIRRILVLGDSFTDGAEVGDQELFTWHLQTCLEDTEVINLGTYGFSTAQELVALQHFGIRYHPDLVIVVTTSNDFHENVAAFHSFGPAPRFVLDGESLRFEGTDHSSAQEVFLATNIPAPRFVHQHSLVYYLLNKHIYQPLIAEKIESVWDARIAATDAGERRELYRRIILRMKEVSEQAGAGFIVVFGKSKHELLEGPISPHAEVARQLASDGVETVDLFESLREAELATPESLYYREDIHWNTRGHRVVADVLAAVIDRWTSRGGSGPTQVFEPSFQSGSCVTGAADRTSPQHQQIAGALVGH